MNTWQKIMQPVRIMSGHPNENKEVKLRLSMVTPECKTLCLFYHLEFEQVKQKKCNGTNIG